MVDRLKKREIKIDSTAINALLTNELKAVRKDEKVKGIRFSEDTAGTYTITAVRVVEED